MYPGVVQVTFLVQLVLVSAFFLVAALRVRRSRTLPRSEPLDGPGHQQRASWSGSHGGPARRIEADATQPEDELALLDTERDRLVGELERLRAAHAQEESLFRERRREVLLEMHEHRRIAADLCAEEPHLQEHVRSLRAEVDHLEHRRVSLAAEVEASIEKSSALRQRIVLAQRELAARRLDRERVERRIRSEAERLRDLAQRRNLLRAETAELAALLDLLQQLSGQSGTLTFLSDGELRPARASRAEISESADVPVTGPSTMVGRNRSTR